MPKKFPVELTRGGAYCGGMETAALICSAVAIVAVGALWKFFVPDYLSEKAKNRAQKEDIAELTEKVESVKHDFEGKVEKLRSDLERGNYVSKLQLETEFATYKEVWQKVVELRNATLGLRPILEGALREGETEESRKQDRLDKLQSAFSDFRCTIDRNKPFYPQEIWGELDKLTTCCWHEAVEFKMTDQWKHRDYWDKATENADKIISQIGTVCEAIRQRLAKLQGGGKQE